MTRVSETRVKYKKKKSSVRINSVFVRGKVGEQVVFEVSFERF